MGGSANVSYNKLWKILIDRNWKKKDLMRETSLSSAVIAKMSKNMPVHLDTLVKVCKALSCDLSDIVDVKISSGPVQESSPNFKAPLAQDGKED